MNAPILNAENQIVPSASRLLKPMRKTKPIWAKKIDRDTSIESLEGSVAASQGDWLCRGIQGEFWPQRNANILAKYVPSEDFDDLGFQRLDPRPNMPVVLAAQIDYAFRVKSNWGMLHGKSGDYLVCSSVDNQDVWIVDKDIFELSYEAVGLPESNPQNE
jgi:hypothetical protein